MASHRFQPAHRPALRTIGRGAELCDAERALFGPFFNAAWYLESHPEVRETGEEPLAHYLRQGAARLYAPNRMFDPQWYIAQVTDRAVFAHPLAHYLRFGSRTGRKPHPLFDPTWYAAQYPEIADSGKIPLEHYLSEGAAEGFAPNPFFDSAWYLEQHPEVAETGEEPLAHYLREGAAKGFAPSVFFDADWYLARYPDAAASGMNPLLHYLRFGSDQGWLPHLFDNNERFRQLRIKPLVAAGRIESAIELINRRERMLSPGRPGFEVRYFPLSTVREAAKAQGHELLHEEKGEPVGYGEPTLVGELARPSEGPVAAPDRYIAELEGATLIGGARYIISSDGRLLHDEEATNAFREGVTVKYLRAWRAPGGAMVVQFKRQAPLRIPVGIHLMSEGDENYFHFIVENLSRLAYLNSFDIDPGVPLILTKGLHANLKSAVEILNTRRRPIIEIEPAAPCCVDRLIYPSDLTRILDIYERPEKRDECVISTKWVRGVRDQVLAAVGRRPGSGTRRLYVRRGRTYRAVTNESLVEEMLSGLGFEIVSSGELSFAEQVRLFAEADFVITPTGAAVTNIMWCRPGTPIVILLSDHPLVQPTLWQYLGESVGVDIRILRGPRAHAPNGLPSVHDDFHIDVDKLRDHVRATMTPDAGRA